VIYIQNVDGEMSWKMAKEDGEEGGCNKD